MSKADWIEKWMDATGCSFKEALEAYYDHHCLANPE